jgi:hypothetical protein
MLDQRQVTKVMELLSRRLRGRRLSTASMPMVAVVAVAVSTLHGAESPRAQEQVARVSESVVEIDTAAALLSAEQPVAPLRVASLVPPPAGLMAEIERHLKRARSTASNLERSALEFDGAAGRESRGGAGAKNLAASGGGRSDAAPIGLESTGDTRSPLKLTPEQRNIASFVASKYRVGVDEVQHFVAHAYRAAREFRLDPHLILAIVAIESSFNPNARSPKGAQGLMQVLTRVHRDKFAPFGGASAAFDPVANITVGSAILKEYLVREGSVEGALKSYVGAALLNHDFGYSRKVLGERIAAAAQGQQLAMVASSQVLPGRPKGKEPVAALTVIPDAARVTPISGVPGDTKAIQAFDPARSSEGTDLLRVGGADLGNVEALAQMMDRLAER